MMASKKQPRNVFWCAVLDDLPFRITIFVRMNLQILNNYFMLSTIFYQFHHAVLEGEIPIIVIQFVELRLKGPADATWISQNRCL